MQAFRIHKGLVAPLDRENVDTDAIIPKQFLKSIKKSGFGPNLFDEWRYLDHGEPGQDPASRKPNPDFVLNQPRYRGASVLLARQNFGCGSSREHAPIALDAAGIEAVVAEFYARIFYRNAVNGGYLIPFECVERLCERVCTGDELSLDVTGSVLHNLTTGEDYALKPLGEVAPILEAGGVFPYARKVGMLKG